MLPLEAWFCSSQASQRAPLSLPLLAVHCSLVGSGPVLVAECPNGRDTLQSPPVDLLDEKRVPEARERHEPPEWPVGAQPASFSDNLLRT